MVIVRINTKLIIQFCCFEEYVFFLTAMHQEERETERKREVKGTNMRAASDTHTTAKNKLACMQEIHRDIFALYEAQASPRVRFFG